MNADKVLQNFPFSLTMIEKKHYVGKQDMESMLKREKVMELYSKFKLEQNSWLKWFNKALGVYRFGRSEEERRNCYYGTENRTNWFCLCNDPSAGSTYLIESLRKHLAKTEGVHFLELSPAVDGDIKFGVQTRLLIIT